MTIADTPSGRLQGQTVLGCRVWKGIAFAAAPVGPLRFRAPEPLPGWSGVRAAVEFGPACPQAFGTRGKPRTRPPAYSEDCLYLNVPLLAGRTREETRTFEILPGPATLPMKRVEVAALIRDQLGEGAERQILPVYPSSRQGNRDISTDATFSLPTLHFAARHSAYSPTWLYRFDARHPLFGAMHGIDLLYLWNVRGVLGWLARGGALTGRRAALAGRYRAAWCEFIRSGSPGEDWPPYDTRTRMTRLFAPTDQVLPDPDREHREAWAGRDVFIGIARAHPADAPG